MVWDYRVRKKITNSLQILFFVGLVSYFLYHALTGDRGLFTLIKNTAKLQELQIELDSFRAERFKTEHKVEILRPDSLDLDLLDEQARNLLSYAKNNEMIYIIDDKLKD